MKNVFRIITSAIAIIAFSLPTFVTAGNLTTTPTNLAAGDETVLHQFISATANTIYLEPVIKYVNGLKTSQCLDTTKGFAVIQDTSRTEWVSFGSNSCNTTTHITILGFVLRGLAPYPASFTAGTGISWDGGAKFKLIDYPILYNYSLYKDTFNTFTGSGAIRCTATNQPCFFTNGVTTAQRDAFSFGTSAGYYPEVFNTTTNTRQYWNGSSWVNYGSGTTINASDTVRGSVQIISRANLNNLTATGSSGAQNVLSPRWVTATGSAHASGNAPYQWMIPALNATGALSASLGGLGRANSTSGAVLISQGSGAVRQVSPTAANDILISTDGRNWNNGQFSQIASVTTLTGTIAASNTITNPVNVYNYFTQTGSIASTYLNTKGYMILVKANGTISKGAGNFFITTKMNGVVLGANCNVLPQASGFWSMEELITVRATGASGTVYFTQNCNFNVGTTLKYSTDGTTATIDTTSTNKFNVGVQFDSSNGSNNAVMQQFIIESHHP